MTTFENFAVENGLTIWTSSADAIESNGFSIGADFRVMTDGILFAVRDEKTHEIISVHTSLEEARDEMMRVAGF